MENKMCFKCDECSNEFKIKQEYNKMEISNGKILLDEVIELCPKCKSNKIILINKN